MSKSKINKWGDGSNFCKDVGKGLVIWEDTEIYKDMKSITSQDVYDEPIWTALNNWNNEECGDDPSDCDGKLVGTLIYSCYEHRTGI